MKKIFSLALVMVLALGLLAGCGSATYEDGTFVGISDEGRGYVKVELTMEGDKITAIDVFEFTNLGIQKDYDTYGNATFTGDMLKDAHETLVADIIEANGTDVDVVTGATSTSNKVIQAVERAMELALVEAASDNTYFNGKFMGVERDDRGAVIVLVTIQDDVITEVTMSETSIRDGAENVKDYETYGNPTFSGEMLKDAHETLAQRFVDANGPEVEAVSGATGTSTKAIEALKDALENAKR